MEYLVIGSVALVVAGMTLFSGFGLGTLLMPAFALFFDLTVAIAATAVVHLANNLFKLYLMGRHADLKLAARFAVPASVAAVAGAFLLSRLSALEPLFGTLAAFVGSFVGKRLMDKVTMREVQVTVGVMLPGLSVLLASGII